MFSNVRSILSQYNAQLRLLELLYDRDFIILRWLDKTQLLDSFRFFFFFFFFFSSPFPSSSSSSSTGSLSSRCDNIYGGPTPPDVAVTFFHKAAKQTSLLKSYLVSFTYPSPTKIRLHYRRLQGHILTLYIKRPNLLKLKT